MIEYIICGILAISCLTAFMAISLAKAKIGWSFVKEEN
jgi:hypothetical protein